MLPASRAAGLRTASAQVAATRARCAGSAASRLSARPIPAALASLVGPAIVPTRPLASNRTFSSTPSAYLPRVRRKRRSAAQREQDEENEQDEEEDNEEETLSALEKKIGEAAASVLPGNGRARVVMMRANPPSPFQPIPTHPDNGPNEAAEAIEAPEAIDPQEKPRRLRKKKSEVPDSSTASRQRRTKDATPSSERASAASAANSGEQGTAAGGQSGNDGSDSPPPPPSPPPVPETYPQVLALPISGRPLFPDHRKVVVLTEPTAMAAIEKVAKSGEPWVGAFLLKNDAEDTDIIQSKDQVHQVGVFCRIVSTWHSRASSTNQDLSNPSDVPEGDKLSILLVPTRRISIEDVFQPKSVSLPSPPSASVEAVPTTAESAAETAQPTEFSEPTTENNKEVEGTKVSEQEANELRALQSDEPYEVRSSVEHETETKVEGVHPRQAETPQAGLLQELDVSMVQVHNLSLEPYELTAPLRSKMNQVIEALNSYWNLTSRSPHESNMAIYRSKISQEMLSNPEALSDFAAAISGIESGQELQRMLEARTIEERLDIALNTVQKDLLNLEMQIRFLRETDQKTQERNKEFVLQEQMKQIKKELGSEAERETVAARFQAKADKLKMPEQVRKAFDEELSKFRSPESQSYDQNVTRNYLEWLTNLPWGITTKERLSTKNAQGVLDNDHYGLKDVKDRILEFLAVGQLKGSIQGKILCLHGPPGVGKTSIGRSIARATDRKFFRFSLGGLGDYAEIKGHRRTYVAAMPGKAVQALKTTQSENPVILLDEVDKVGEGRAHGGDPSAALLEMLDPEQNHNFLDHYLDVPIDLSRVLFVCTANDPSRIPRPLWDRMEAIEVTSYTPEEQFQIAKGYLVPNAMKENGLVGGDISMPDELIRHILQGYIRESGVRGLQKTLNKVYRKIAYRLVTQFGDVAEVVETDVEAETSAGEKPSEASDDHASASKEADASEPKKSEGQEAEAELEPKKEDKPLIERLNLPQNFKMIISEADIHDFLGPPYPNTDRLFPTVMPSGVSNGLAFTSTGAGTLTPIEATLLPGTGQVRLTGSLGQVIQESAQLALSWVKSNAKLLGVDPAWMEKQDLHLHMPDGQTPKDGPSAGVALITCLVSLVLNKPVPHTLAMTGEASLRGVVLPVGGLKEKLIAAHRNQMKTLILPAAVQPRVETDVAKEVRDAMDIHYVHDVFSALDVAFGPGPWSTEAQKLAGHRANVASGTQDPAVSSPHPAPPSPRDTVPSAV